MKQTSRQRVGHWGENTAAHYLENKGYRILGRNVRTPYGEIDVIASREDMLFFVEVKTRTNRQFGFPESAVTIKKLDHMLSSAQSFIQDHAEFQNTSWQLDVIAVRAREDDSVEIEHFENVAP